MRQFFYIVLFAWCIATMASCSDDEATQQVTTYTIDFEDNHFDSAVADNASTWNFMKEGYTWIELQSSLYHEAVFTHDYGYALYGGGLTLSSYNTSDIDGKGTYESDLYVYNSASSNPTAGGGYGGSDTFLICYGNFDAEIDPDLDLRPMISFADKRPRTIKGCQVNSTSYFLNIVENGNPYSPALKDGEEIKIYATGYDAAGKEGKTVSMTLAKKGSVIKSWTSWDLTPLGEVVRVKFNIKGGNTDEWGMTSPKYFAIDNIVIQERE